MKKPTVLCILDGVGLNPKDKGNAFTKASTPTLDKLFETCSHNTLVTYGEEVGLPEGQMGNSEVGHLNIGAGRVIEQWLLKISNKLKGDFIKESKEYINFIDNTKNSNNIHIIGLFSDGGVHSHNKHLELFITQITKNFSGKINLHLITDGRDTSPTRAGEQIEELEAFISEYANVQIATVSGRYHTMDRDKRWDRTEKGYNAIALAKADKFSTAKECISNAYENDITDEFIEPAVINESPILEDDGIVFFNFRADRMRQIVSALCINDFDGFNRTHSIPNTDNVLCFTNYDESLKLPFLFTQDKIVNHIGEVVSQKGYKQLRVAETEKYPHVTFFFNGLSDVAVNGEERELLPSPRDVKTYDLKPEMSAQGVKQAVVNGINSGKYEFIVVNFANCDMVGHTGVVEAGIKAVETVDKHLGDILDALKEKNGQAIIIADHGNCEKMMNEDGSPNTAHTTFLVPIILFNADEKYKIKSSGALCDVAPTVLDLMQIEIPKEMTGNSLV